MTKVILVFNMKEWRWMLNMIGLVDLDLQASTSTTSLIPNLEIMKLATYYTQEENHFCRLIGLNETELSAYDKIYIFSEKQNHALVPPQFMAAKQVEFGGSGFTNGKYVPFTNSVIDFMLPKPTIYKGFLQEKYDEGIKSKLITQFLDNTYYRAYAGEDALPLPPILPNKRLIWYDIDFFVPNWKKIIQTISSRKPSTIKRIHPIICSNLTQFFEIREFPKLSRENDVILDMRVPLEELHYMFKKYLNLFLADITPSTNVFLPLGRDCKTTIQFANNFLYTLNLVYAFWSHGIHIKVKYMPPPTGINNPFINLSLLFVQWTNHEQASSRKFDITLQDKLKRKKGKNIENEEWHKLLTYSHNISDKFLVDYSWNKLQQGGVWRI